MTSSSELRRQTALLRDATAAPVRAVAWDAELDVDVRRRRASDSLGAPVGRSACHVRDADPAATAGGPGGLSAAWEAGRAAGYRAGLVEAEREQTAWLAERDERDRRDRARRASHWDLLATAVMEAVEATSRELRLEELHETAARMGVEIAEALVGHHLRVAECAARDAVQRALAEAPRDSALTVRLHPDDADLVAACAEEIAPGRRLEVVADPAVEEGGCVVEVGERTIDAQVGAALRRVREVLER